MKKVTVQGVLEESQFFCDKHPDRECYSELKTASWYGSNHDIQCYETKRRPYVVDGEPSGAPIEIVHNVSLNKFVYVEPGTGSFIEVISQDDAKAIMDDGHKLMWKHSKDIGTTAYKDDGKVEFYPYIPKKTI